jgi:hypothetical protein
LQIDTLIGRVMPLRVGLGVLVLLIGPEHGSLEIHGASFFGEVNTYCASNPRSRVHVGLRRANDDRDTQELRNAVNLTAARALAMDAR